VTVLSFEKASSSDAAVSSDQEGSPPHAGIEWIDGAVNGLIIAPHGVTGNDDNTGTLARHIARHSGFHAAINEVFKRPNHPRQADPENHMVDLNRIDQVTTHLDRLFLKPLLERKENLVKKHGELLIAMIHGINDANLQRYIVETDAPPDTAVLIGYGQGDRSHSWSASSALVDNLIDLLKTNPFGGITAQATALSYHNYRGGHRNNLNQLFRQDDHLDNRVQSIQLEITWTGYRDTPLNIEQTARSIGWSLERVVLAPFG
jgi:hypothetical protein